MLRRGLVLTTALAASLWVPGGAALAAPASPSQLLPRATTPVTVSAPVVPATSAEPSTPPGPPVTAGETGAGAASSSTGSSGDAGPWAAAGGTLVLVAAGGALLLRRRRVEPAVPRGAWPSSAPGAGRPARDRRPDRQVRRPAAGAARPARTSTVGGRSGAVATVDARPRSGPAEPAPQEVADGTARQGALPPAGAPAGTTAVDPAGLTAVQRAARGLPLRVDPVPPVEPASAAAPAQPSVAAASTDAPPAARVRPTPARPLAKRKGRR